MGLEDLPGDVRYRVDYFHTESERWDELGTSMGSTYTTLNTGARIPPFSERIPQNLRSFGEAANTAFDAYVAVLDDGARCASSVGATLAESGRAYLRAEGYAEGEIQTMAEELEE